MNIDIELETKRFKFIFLFSEFLRALDDDGQTHRDMYAFFIGELLIQEPSLKEWFLSNVPYDDEQTKDFLELCNTFVERNEQHRNEFIEINNAVIRERAETHQKEQK